MTAGTFTTSDGRSVRYFDTGGDAGAPVVVWHHGTPQTGAVIEPLASEAARRGFRVVSCARPGYPGSTERAGRSVADAAWDVLAVTRALGIERFASLGASGGGPHALACAALAPERVRAVVAFAGIAPYWGDPDWFAGMADPSGLRSALAGRQARLDHAATAAFDPKVFTAADLATLGTSWKALGPDSNAGSAEGPAGEADDDVAYVTPPGFELGSVVAPALLVQGGADRIVPAPHAGWQLERLPHAELWLRPRDGHISVLTVLGVTLDWVASLAP